MGKLSMAGGFESAEFISKSCHLAGLTAALTGLATKSFWQDYTSKSVAKATEDWQLTVWRLRQLLLTPNFIG